MNFEPNDSFVAYSRPGSLDFKLIFQNNRGFTSGFVPDTPQFFIESFIRTGKSSTSILAENIISNQPFSFNPIEGINYDNIPRSKYLQQVEKIVRTIELGSLQKVVYSRKKCIDKENVHVWEVFSNLVIDYPEVFVFCYHVPGRGCWIGATPEVLIKRLSNTQVTTMALAGTQLDHGIPLERVKWGEKEVKEQAFLKDFIKLKLDALGIDYIEVADRTMRAGKLLHICTQYNIDLGNRSLDELGRILHPGPAISGTPQDEAIKYIIQLEPHKREDYCGYLGPVAIDDDDGFYINLRSMKVFKNGFALFIGGGITAESDPLSEWVETESKANTLLNIIEQSSLHKYDLK